MTDRYHSLIVVLERDTRSDDSEPIIEAIRMIRGVLSVTPQVHTSDNWMELERVRREMRNKLFKILD